MNIFSAANFVIGQGLGGQEYGRGRVWVHGTESECPSDRGVTQGEHVP